MDFNGGGTCIWRSQELGSVKGGKEYRKVNSVQLDTGYS